LMRWTRLRLAAAPVQARVASMKIS
jgi:hypothetical protein